MLHLIETTSETSPFARTRIDLKSSSRGARTFRAGGMKPMAIECSRGSSKSGAQRERIPFAAGLRDAPSTVQRELTA